MYRCMLLDIGENGSKNVFNKPAKSGEGLVMVEASILWSMLWLGPKRDDLHWHAVVRRLWVFSIYIGWMVLRWQIVVGLSMVPLGRLSCFVLHVCRYPIYLARCFYGGWVLWYVLVYLIKYMNWHLPADLGSHASRKVHFSCWIPKEVMVWSFWVLAFAGHASSYLEVWNIEKTILILSFGFLAALVANSTINFLQGWFVKKIPIVVHRLVLCGGQRCPILAYLWPSLRHRALS